MIKKFHPSITEKAEEYWAVVDVLGDVEDDAEVDVLTNRMVAVAEELIAIPVTAFCQLGVKMQIAINEARDLFPDYPLTLFISIAEEFEALVEGLGRAA